MQVPFKKNNFEILIHEFYHENEKQAMKNLIKRVL